MNSKLSVNITLWCNRILAAIVVGMIFGVKPLMMWYQQLRPLVWQATAAVVYGYWICVPAVLYALLCIEKLLGNIRKDVVFVSENVRYIRRIRWCCAGVSAVSLVVGLLYPPLLFLAVIMAFLALVVSVVKNVMAAAVEIREENDLTV